MNFIDLDNSYIYNHPHKENACRLAIKSIQFNNFKTFYPKLKIEINNEISIKICDYKIIDFFIVVRCC